MEKSCGFPQLKEQTQEILIVSFLLIRFFTRCIQWRVTLSASATYSFPFTVTDEPTSSNFKTWNICANYYLKWTEFKTKGHSSFTVRTCAIVLYCVNSEAALQTCSYITLFREYAANLQENNQTEVWKQLYWNHTSAWVFFCNFAAYFQITFS